jgi:hypothetical protein
VPGGAPERCQAGGRVYFTLEALGKHFHVPGQSRTHWESVAGPAEGLTGLFEGFGQGTGQGVDLPGVFRVDECLCHGFGQDLLH